MCNYEATKLCNLGRLRVGLTPHVSDGRLMQMNPVPILTGHGRRLESTGNPWCVPARKEAKTGTEYRE